MSEIKTKFIEDDAITSPKIADDAVGSSEIDDGSVTDADLASTYTKANGSVPFTADQSLGGFKITNLGTPSIGTDASTKNYADSIRTAINSATAQEVPSGTINGVNTTFTLAFTPAANSWVELYLNGLYLEPTVDYSISSATITMVTAPVAGQKLRAFYLKG